MKHVFTRVWQGTARPANPCLHMFGRECVNHTILCRKLEKSGIQHRALEWFQSYLTNRKQKVKYSSIISDLKFISRGVPQGSNLGPLLFILYINEINNISDSCNAVCYADDCNLIFQLKPNEAHTSLPQKVNTALAAYAEWFAANDLALNAQETSFMVFSGRRKINIDGICINNTILNQVNYSNFLGITIDDQLSWRQHITFTSKILSKSIGVLKKVAKHLPRRILMQLYSS